VLAGAEVTAADAELAGVDEVETLAVAGVAAIAGALSLALGPLDTGAGALAILTTETATGVCVGAGAGRAVAVAAVGGAGAVGGAVSVATVAVSFGSLWCAAGAGPSKSAGRLPRTVIVRSTTATTVITAARTMVTLRPGRGADAGATDGATEPPGAMPCGIAPGGGANGDGGGYELCAFEWIGDAGTPPAGGMNDAGACETPRAGATVDEPL
jgi:hypothetical protein